MAPLPCFAALCSQESTDPAIWCTSVGSKNETDKWLVSLVVCRSSHENPGTQRYGAPLLVPRMKPSLVGSCAWIRQSYKLEIMDRTTNNRSRQEDPLHGSSPLFCGSMLTRINGHQATGDGTMDQHMMVPVPHFLALYLRQTQPSGLLCHWQAECELGQTHHTSKDNM